MKIVSPHESRAIAPSTKRASDDPEKIRDSAQQFEALLIAQLLKSARSDSSAWGAGEDKTAESVIDMAEEKVAELLAASGGLGMARTLAASVSPAAYSKDQVAVKADKGF